MATNTRRRGVGPDLATFLRDTAGRGNWGHTGLARLLRGVSLDEAIWTPGTAAHSIWEEVNHVIYWSEDVLDRLEGRAVARRQAWPAGDGSPDAWRRAVARAGRLHAALVRHVGALTPAGLARTAMRTRNRSTAQLVLGGVAHIAYHAGRIALLRRLYAHARQSGGPAV
ncbi:MAG: DinB family protein [Armatimonadota bacterium]|nr:DinB family protein [Armatimonadota bacterium]